VTFPVPQELLPDVKKASFDRDSVIVRIRLADGSIYGHDGEVRFAEVQATVLTDSVIIRATMPNPERYLVDQQLVTVLVARRKPEKKLVVSQSALLLDQQGPYVLAVGPDQKVAIKRIVTGEQRAPFIIVTSGLEPGDKVIVSGHQKVRPGQVVSAHSAESSAAKGEASGQ
jgi:membrane fusion protein (multidrug efflux system)